MKISQQVLIKQVKVISFILFSFFFLNPRLNSSGLKQTIIEEFPGKYKMIFHPLKKIAWFYPSTKTDALMELSHVCKRIKTSWLSPFPDVLTHTFEKSSNHDTSKGMDLTHFQEVHRQLKLNITLVKLILHNTRLLRCIIYHDSFQHFMLIGFFLEQHKIKVHTQERIEKMVK